MKTLDLKGLDRKTVRILYDAYAAGYFMGLDSESRNPESEMQRRRLQYMLKKFGLNTKVKVFV